MRRSPEQRSRKRRAEYIRPACIRLIVWGEASRGMTHAAGRDDIASRVVVGHGSGGRERRAVVAHLFVVARFGERLEASVGVVAEEPVAGGVAIRSGVVPLAQAAAAQEGIGSLGERPVVAEHLQ